MSGIHSFDCRCDGRGILPSYNRPGTVRPCPGLRAPTPGVMYIPDRIKDEFMEKILEYMSKPIEDRRTLKMVGTWHGRDIWEVSGEPLPPPVRGRDVISYRYYSEELGCYLRCIPPSDPRRPQNLLPLVSS